MYKQLFAEMELTKAFQSQIQREHPQIAIDQIHFQILLKVKQTYSAMLDIVLYRGQILKVSWHH